MDLHRCLHIGTGFHEFIKGANNARYGMFLYLITLNISLTCARLS
jgi:hypothetical protein